jgi:hypothetical protein
VCAWTYSGNPNSSNIDATHYHLGDTLPSDPIATDEECAYALAQNRNHPMLAAAALAETKAAQFIMRPTMVRRGDRITSYGQDMAQAFLTLAKQLRNNASLATATVYAGAMSLGEKSSNRRETDLPQPFARVDLHSPRRYPSPEAEERDP